MRVYCTGQACNWPRPNYWNDLTLYNEASACTKLLGIDANEWCPFAWSQFFIDPQLTSFNEYPTFGRVWPDDDTPPLDEESLHDILMYLRRYGMDELFFSTRWENVPASPFVRQDGQDWTSVIFKFPELFGLWVTGIVPPYCVTRGNATTEYVISPPFSLTYGALRPPRCHRYHLFPVSE